MFKRELEILQPHRGHRITTDTLLLRDFIKIKRGERVCELGCGSGFISISLGMEGKASKILGIEIQRELVEIARKNVIMNGLEGIVEIIEGDLRSIKTIVKPSIFDVVIANPPYIKMGRGRPSPDPQRSIARQEVKGTLEDWIYAASYLLKSGGRAYFIFLPDRLSEIIEKMKSRRIEPKIIQFIYPHQHKPSNLFLLQAVKDGREGISVLPPHIISDS